MKKLNDWYDALPTRKREIFFVAFVGGSMALAQIALWVYNVVWALPVWVIVMTTLRISYLTRPKKLVYDVEGDMKVTQQNLKDIEAFFKLNRTEETKNTNPSDLFDMSIMDKIIRSAKNQGYEIIDGELKKRNNE